MKFVLNEKLPTGLILFNGLANIASSYLRRFVGRHVAVEDEIDNAFADWGVVQIQTGQQVFHRSNAPVLKHE